MFDPGPMSSPIIVNSTRSSGHPTSASTSTHISSYISNSTPVATPVVSSFSHSLGSTSISAISLSRISPDYPTVISTRTSVVRKTTITVSVVKTAVLSTDTPHTGFHLRTGAVVGIALGGTFLLLVIILLLFFACRRHSNTSYNSSEDIFAVSHNTSWRSPLETDDDENHLAPYDHSVSPKYLGSFGSEDHDEGRSFGDHLSVEGSGSAESAEANGRSLMTTAFGGLSPVVQTRSKHSRGSSMSHHFSDHGHDTSPPWWRNTEPLSINKHNSSQLPPLSVESPVLARSIGSSGSDGSPSSNGHCPGSSGETLLSGGETRRSSITKPSPIHKLSGRGHHSTSPKAFILGRDSSLQYAAQPIQQQKQQDHINQSISQIILARLRTPSTATTVKSYSQCTTTRPEELLCSSRLPSHIYSPSLLNPPMVVPGLYLPPDVTGSSAYTPESMFNQHPHHHQRASETSEKLFWPAVTLPPVSPVPSTDTWSMVEGLLHPRLGMTLAPSQQNSFMSLGDHEDYTRPINGLVNNHIQSTTTFDTVDLGEVGSTI